MSDFDRLRRYLPDGSNPGRPVCLASETFAALLDVAEAAENYDETDIRVKSIVRKGNANSSDVRDLGRTRRELRYALDRLREVTGHE